MRDLRAAADLSYEAAAQRAIRAGHNISDSYLGDVERGVAGNPTTEKILGIAAAYGRPPHEVFDVAAGIRFAPPDLPHLRRLLAEFHESTESLSSELPELPPRLRILCERFEALAEQDQQALEIYLEGLELLIERRNVGK